jgi:TonB-linked SusC/RagA family outer membrane protein
MKLLTKNKPRNLRLNDLSRKIIKLTTISLLTLTLQVSAAEVPKTVIFSGTNFPQEQKQIKGKVTNEKGDPLVGATVQVKGSNVAVLTKEDGSFSIEVPKNSTKLVVSYVGMESQEVTIENTTLTIILKEIGQKLDEVVVMGYTTQKSNKISGSVAVVKAAQLRDVTEGDVGKMLQGKVSGVFVGSSSGQPGSAPVIRIRGNGTVTAGSDPLYVVDGVIGGIPNPSDVESMTILKDAASTTLYGSRAANGVIVVTTKRGKAGKTLFDFRTSSGSGHLDNGNFKLMNSTQLYDTYARALAGAGNNPAEIEALLPASRKDVNTNWQDVAYQDGINTSYELNISGGNEKTRFYIGSNYYKEDGIVVGTGIDRYSFRLNLDHNISDKFKLSANIASTITKSNNSPDGALYESYTNLPWDKAFDKNGNPIDPNTADEWFGRDYTNFAFERQYNYNRSRDMGLEGLFKAEYSFTESLSFSSTNRAEFWNGFNENYNDVRSTSGSYSNGYLYNYNGSSRSYLTSNLLKYNKTFGEHQVQVLLGHEYQLNQDQYSDSDKSGFLPGLDVLSAGATVINASGNRNENKFLSGFMQANYNYSDKYYLTTSFRRDGSSRFGSNNQYANFYAVGGSWIVSKESFMESIPAISNLKLRSSYGTTGNADIKKPDGSLNYYGGIDYYSVNSSYNGAPGAVLYQIGNKDLTWEKSATLDIGLDVSVLKDRITLTTDFYDKKTKDLLFNVPQPANVGVGSITQNVGSVKNVGFEFGLNTKNLIGDFKWSTDFNIAFNKNEITELYNNLSFIDVPSFGAQRLIVGQDMHTWFTRKWVGVDPANGDPLWEVQTKNAQTGQMDISTTNVYKNATLIALGKATPDFFGGMRNTFSYKGFELNTLLNFVYGNEIYNNSRALFDSDGAYNTYNMMQLQDGWSRWEKPGDIATHPKLVSGGNKNSQRGSSRFIEDGSFLRLRNVTFSYNIPTSQLERIHLRSARISISGDNLYTWTKFSGIDPEVDDFGAVGTKYPYAKKFQLGLQLGF